MKQFNIYAFLLLTLMIAGGCKKDNYPGGEISQYIAIFDVRDLYSGNDVALTTEALRGSSKLAAMVVSDHSGNNLPAGLLVVQDSRRLSKLRGISIQLGADAAKYQPGDSVIINITGGVLKRVDGILQITGINNSAVTKVSSGNTIPLNRVPASQILSNPGDYESTLSVIVKGGFNPLPKPGDKIGGDKLLNDGFGNITLHTEARAAFADSTTPFLANFYGIVFNAKSGDTLAPQLRIRNYKDVTVLSSTINVAPIVISGFASDVKGADGNYEYVQLLATQDIDFAATPYSFIVNNNANASTPTGFPVNGWATGGMRTYKINITQGKVAKGAYCYVGGTTKMINGAGSTVMSTSNWVRMLDYTKYDGDDFGLKTGGLMANSGNSFGMAIFAGTKVTADSQPVDAVFISNGGSLYTAGPPALGYRIPNNDFYDAINPITLKEQAFYRSGSNTLCFAYNTADMGYFNQLGGVYSPALGRWMKARSQTNILMSKMTVAADIEGAGSTALQ
ncbi:DUF5689 domain-containing protein [Chitinophaga vietnamensis]|uniref:DUF5689 domain-containing protein n=1 Tax=Chitinophaga vietnamensis TaxID=2593957 RepID=UPI0011789FB7|nr:DUF5689 domain-containing protein [Chitinophaga vietnamensis]